MTKEEIIQGLYRGDSRAIKEAIKVLEQETVPKESYDTEQGNKKIINWLDNFFRLEFPKDFDEFANDYGFTDDKEIYTNGSRLIPVFRVKQWLDHMKLCEDCVSRQAVKEGMIKYGFRAPDMTVTEFIENELPPVTPTHPNGTINGI